MNPSSLSLLVKTPGGGHGVRLRSGWGYAFAFVAVAATLGLRLALPAGFREQPVLILFMFPVILSAYLGGQGPGCFATVLAALAMDLFFLPPFFSLRVARGYELLDLGLFTACGALVSTMTSAWHRSRADLGAASEDFRTIEQFNRAIVDSVNAERRKAELALRESEKRFQDIARASSDWFWELDRQGRYTYVSESVAPILGYEPGEMLGRSVLEGFPPEYRQGMEIRYGSLFAEGRAFNDLPGVLLRKDGTRGHTLSTGAPLLDEAGALVGFRGLDRDVTKVKAAEEEHRRLEGELVQVQKLESIGRLAGGVAHDFNNMLGVILGQAEVAMMTPGSRPFHPFLTEITKAAQRSGELTRQLLAFARKQTITPKVLDLNETLQGMLKMLGRLIGEDIALAFVRKEGLWKVRMDPSQIDQILANLTVNARDAIAGVGRITIALENQAVGEALLGEHPAAVGGEFVVLSVEDSGCGMEPDVLRHIFEPFFTTKEVGKGTGLGLATVFGIVKQNDGFILVDSAPRVGTRFRIFLPRHPEGDGEERRQDAPSAIPAGRGETILLVEDEAAVLAATRLLLERLGYAVVPARGPLEALLFAQSFKGGFDLLVTDVVMPEMNGRELSERIQTHRPGLPVLFMSGYTADILSPHGVLEEGVHFLPKPATLVELARCVDAVLRGRPLV